MTETPYDTWRDLARVKVRIDPLPAWKAELDTKRKYLDNLVRIEPNLSGDEIGEYPLMVRHAKNEIKKLTGDIEAEEVRRRKESARKSITSKINETLI